MSQIRRVCILFICSLALLLPGCEDDVDCTNALPPPNWFQLGFFTTNGEPLIGTLYKSEGFRLYNADTELSVSPMRFGDTTRLLIRYDDVLPDVEYYIELTQEDTDTLSFSYEIRQDPCFLIYTLQEVTHNGESVSFNSPFTIDILK